MYNVYIRFIVHYLSMNELSAHIINETKHNKSLKN